MDHRRNNGSVKAVSPRHCPATCALRNCCFNCCVWTESQRQCPLHCCWRTTWTTRSKRSPTYAAQLHLPTHDLFRANLKVQLHLPPLRSLELAWNLVFEDVPRVEFIYLVFDPHAQWELLQVTQVFAALVWRLSSANQLPCLLLRRCFGTCSVSDITSTSVIHCWKYQFMLEQDWGKYSWRNHKDRIPDKGEVYLAILRRTWTALGSQWGGGGWGRGTLMSASTGVVVEN